MININPKVSQNVTSVQSGKKIKNYVYQYSDMIGKGNFARVYRGQNTLTQEVVAIKIVSLDALKSKRLQQLIFEEIRILQQMNHPNIVKFYQALLSDRNCYIITELCNQGDLEDRIKKKKPFLESQLNKIILDMYHGLRYLRDMGVTHRDFKTANIFMHNGVAKIADFGLAKFYKQRFKDLDIGSPLYMSPQGLIYNFYGEKTDIWAFGIIIYELIHGETPFCNCPTEADLKNSAIKPIPEHKFKKNIHPQLRQLMNILLEINQFKRPNIYELAYDPYIKNLLGNQIQGNLKKKIVKDVPLITLNQSLNGPNIPLDPKQNTFLHLNTLQSPIKSINPNKSIDNPSVKQAKKQQRKISFHNSKTIQLGGNKNNIQFNYKPTLPIKIIQNEQNITPRPNSAYDQKNKVTTGYNEHPHLMSNFAYQILRQREFSEKTIETKESQEEKAYSFRGEQAQFHVNFHNN